MLHNASCVPEISALQPQSTLSRVGLCRDHQGAAPSHKYKFAYAISGLPREDHLRQYSSVNDGHIHQTHSHDSPASGQPLQPKIRQTAGLMQLAGLFLPYCAKQIIRLEDNRRLEALRTHPQRMNVASKPHSHPFLRKATRRACNATSWHESKYKCSSDCSIILSKGAILKRYPAPPDSEAYRS